MQLNIIKHRYIWFAISGVLIGSNLLFLALFGLKQGIDLTGGSMLVVRYEDQRPTPMEAEQAVSSLNLGGMVIQPVGENDMSFRMKTLDEETHQQVLTVLQEEFGVINELRFDSIGPVVGHELRVKSLMALAIVSIAILIYIGWAFRQVSVPVKAWKYGFITILSALQSIVVPVGLFALLGKLNNVEIGTAFIAAVLTILGYSINDTIVVLDRVRENLQRSTGTFEEIVNVSLNQTIWRSINTTVTTLLALVAIFLFGGDSIKDFALALIVGIATGAYSSIFFATPLLVTWHKISLKRKAARAK